MTLPFCVSAVGVPIHARAQPATALKLYRMFIYRPAWPDRCHHWRAAFQEFGRDLGRMSGGTWRWVGAVRGPRRSTQINGGQLGVVIRWHGQIPSNTGR
ncbi:hypothetical protein D3C79_946770 [compost metagenome]